MAVVDTQRRKAAAPALTPEAHARPTLRALAVVDGSAGAGRVIKYLIDLHRGGAPLDVVLLNIQPRPQEWRLRGYGWFARDAIHDRLINDLGRRIVASAARYLDSVGISHRDRIELGDRGETILRCVREEGCDLLVLADCRHGAIRQWLARTGRISIGSVACFVAAGANVPVVIVPRA